MFVAKAFSSRSAVQSKILPYSVGLLKQNCTKKAVAKPTDGWKLW